DLGSVPMETSDEDLLPQYTWLEYHDNYFENGYAYGSANGFLAVRFTQPVSATSCMVKRIRFNVWSNPSNVQLRAWNDLSNNPNSLIYTSFTISTYLYQGWNTIYLDIDVSDYNSFYVGYYQIYYAQPYLSADQTTPIYGRSYWKNVSQGSDWGITSDADYAIEVYVEYTTTSPEGKSVVKNTWISADTN
ncbi:MAG: hypothetical protein KAR38_15595, partial [Calditrichia bacterium]|nr:hypothetical protein [Calditrichia bacterium]